MNADRTTDEEIRYTIERLGALVFARDPAIVDEFAPNGMLVGSEPGEIVRGHTELGAFFAALFAAPARVTWAWRTIDISSAGDTAWFFTEGEAVMTDADDVERRLAYRLSGMLTGAGGAWKWRLFHGSEPKA